MAIQSRLIFTPLLNVFRRYLDVVRGTSSPRRRRSAGSPRRPSGHAAPVRLLPLLLVVPLLAGCSEAVTAVDTATRARDCVALARDVAATGLGQVPSQQQAEEAVRRLDERVDTLDSPEVRDAATSLRDRLQELVDATRSGNPADATRAAAEARAAAERTAETCGLPVGQFLGG